MTAEIEALDRAELAAARALLAGACAFERAEVVAEEKLFGTAPRLATIDGRFVEDGEPHVPRAFGAYVGDELAGVAAIAGDRIRVLAVAPAHRGFGIGTQLLEACAATHTTSRLRVLDQPGNYLAPGVDARDTETIAWLGRRGFTQVGEPRANCLIAVRDNPRVTAERATEAAETARERGFEIRRALPDEPELYAAARDEFGGAWPFELARAGADTHVALKDGRYCAFAAHDGNNRGLGWFGPTGTWPAHRGQGLGEALLLACLVDVAAAQHVHCEIAWIGPRPFYDKIGGVVADRAFLALAR